MVVVVCCSFTIANLPIAMDALTSMITLELESVVVAVVALVGTLLTISFILYRIHETAKAPDDLGERVKHEDGVDFGPGDELEPPAVRPAQTVPFSVALPHMPTSSTRSSTSSRESEPIVGVWLCYIGGICICFATSAGNMP